MRCHAREYYKANRPKLLKYAKKWRQGNPEKAAQSLRKSKNLHNVRIARELVPQDIFCAYMTSKTSAERGKNDC